MTDASLPAPKTNDASATNNSHARRPHGPRPDMATQLQQLGMAAAASPAAGDGGTPAGAATAKAARSEPRRNKPPRGQRPQQQHQQQRQANQPRKDANAKDEAWQQRQPAADARPQRKVNPVLEKLFELHPKLFGARFVPLKLGVYEDLLTRHPDAFKAEDLKVAMGQHARSTRYLESVAAGHQRHDLDGNPVEPVAPEHVHHAILELHRRRAQRANGEDLRPQLVQRIARAIEASGLEREAYAVLVRSRDEKANAVVDDALAELAAQAAKREALLRAFEASGGTEQAFAEMYGMKPGEVARTLQRARKDRSAPATAAATTAATDTVAGNSTSTD